MAISKKSMVSGTSKKSTKKPSAKATGPIAASKLKTASSLIKGTGPGNQ